MRPRVLSRVHTAAVRVVANAPPLLAIAAFAIGCSGPEAAPRVTLPVVVDSSGLVPVETDLGYRVELSRADVAVRDIEFTVAGEVHSASLWRRLTDLVVPVARAHPGHYQGGTVTGELRGDFLLRFAPGDEHALGTATLVVGDYESVNFTFARAATGDGGVLGQSDGSATGSVLLGHTAVLEGLASKGTEEIPFRIVIDSPEDRKLVGAPFVHTVSRDGGETLGVRLLTRDPLEGDSLFDELDFAELSDDESGHLELGPETTGSPHEDAYNLIRRTFQTHDHFDVRAQPDSQ